MTAADFLRAVLTYSAEDAPRLLYADHLAEHGQEERAEFIRVQCELARLGPCLTPSGGFIIEGKPAQCYQCRQRNKKDCLPWCSVCERRYDLLTWQKELADRHIESRGQWHLCRGFIAELTCTWADWLAHESKLFWHPTQTEECPNCGGDGDVGPHNSDWGISGPCPGCGGRWDAGYEYSNGTGRIPREMPAGAQPIERVILTTFPTNISVLGVERWHNGIQFTRHPEDAENGVNIWRCERWPRVEFAMPEGEAAEERVRRNRAAFPTTTISGW